MGLGVIARCWFVGCSYLGSWVGVVVGFGWLFGYVVLFVLGLCDVVLFVFGFDLGLVVWFGLVVLVSTWMCWGCFAELV